MLHISTKFMEDLCDEHGDRAADIMHCRIEIAMECYDGVEDAATLHLTRDRCSFIAPVCNVSKTYN